MDNVAVAAFAVQVFVIGMLISGSAAVVGLSISYGKQLLNNFGRG